MCSTFGLLAGSIVGGELNQNAENLLLAVVLDAADQVLTKPGTC